MSGEQPSRQDALTFAFPGSAAELHDFWSAGHLSCSCASPQRPYRGRAYWASQRLWQEVHLAQMTARALVIPGCLQRQHGHAEHADSVKCSAESEKAGL